MQRARITGPGAPLELVTVDIPEPPSEGLLVKMAYAGVCRSDIYYISDNINLGAGKVAHYSDVLRSRGSSFVGVTPGHEMSGTIAKFGANSDAAKHGLKEGDSVLVYPWLGCQTCGMCKHGYGNVCDQNYSCTTDLGQGPAGGYQEYVCVPHCKYAIKLPEAIPLNMACMVPCSGATSYGAIVKARPYVNLALSNRDRARVLVLGAGGVGSWCLGLLRLMLPDPRIKILAADIAQNKLDGAVKCGAHEGIVIQRDDMDASIAAVTAGGKIDAFLDFVGTESSTQLGLSSLSQCGTLVVIGVAGGLIKHPMLPMVAGSVAIQGTRTAPIHELMELIALLSKEKINIPNLEYYSLSQINEVLDKLRNGQINGRAVIKY